jgi:signal transduction histidine kinase
MLKNAEHHLKRACQFTGAAWAALVERETGHWFVACAHRLPKSKYRLLGQHLDVHWKARTRRGGYSGASKGVRRLKQDSGLGAVSLHVIRVDSSAVIVVGGGVQTRLHKEFWSYVAGILGSSNRTVSTDLTLPGLQTQLAYDMPQALGKLLAGFVHAPGLRGAWIGIRRGESLGVEAHWNSPHLRGVSLALDSSRLLRRVRRLRADVSVVRDQPEWRSIPHAVGTSSRFWTCFPLVIGRRLIGAVALWGKTELPTREMRVLRALAMRSSQSVESLITLNEMTGQLKRLGLVNDFALALSSAQSLDQIARHVIDHITGAFPTQSVSLYVPSLDSRFLQEFSSRDGHPGWRTTSLEGHLLYPLLVADPDASSRSVRSPDSKPPFRLRLPLKFRGQPVGVLELASDRDGPFSQYDARLLGVIASHLAGTIEYARLRAETEARARNLGLIHEVVQQVIGLNDRQQVAQITADLLAKYFAYESANVVLRAQGSESLICGYGGRGAEATRNDPGDADRILRDDITAHVFRTGESLLLNDMSDWPQHVAPPGAVTRSEVCVALKHGGTTSGLIDVRSSQADAFNGNDILALEALAGVLSAVVSGVGQYERLQESVRELRSAQEESGARLRAQLEAEGRLVHAAKLAAVGEMAAGIAHELNNPLTTVAGFAELLLDETPAGAANRADLEMVLHESLRARGVVRRLLDFARQGERTRARTDMNEILDDVLALTTHFIHTSGVRLEVRRGENIPRISADANQLKQVLLNLVHNALQAMPAGGDLQIAISQKPRDGRDWVVIDVADNGIGIDPKDIDRIFEPFFTTRGRHGGTGLGLSVTYGIVSDHGGTIEVESKPGEGARFSVWLPA